MQNYLLITVSEEPAEFLTSSSSFFDLNQMCFDKYSVEMQAEYVTAFSNRIDTYMVSDCVVVFASKVSQQLNLIGWYDNATINLYPQLDEKSFRDYYIMCPSNNVWYFEDNAPPILDISVFENINFLSEDEALLIDKLLQTSKSSAISAKFDFIEMVSADIEVELEHEDKHKARMRQYEENKSVSLLREMYSFVKRWSMHAPNNALAHDYLGYIYLQYGHPEEALVCFERALIINPEYAPTVAGKGECLIRLGRAKEATAWFNDNLNINDADYIRLHLAEAYEFLGFQTQAYRILKAVTNPEYLPEVKTVISEMERTMPYLVNTNEALENLDTYFVYLDIEKKKQPEIIYDSNNIERYIDPIRKKSVIVTPEESVRQRVITFLREDLCIPPEYVEVEESLAHIDRDIRDRVDILVFGIKDGVKKNLLLIECKAPGIPLVGEPTAQILRYNRILSAPFIMLTDGDVSLLYHFEHSTGKYAPLRYLPNFNDMLTELNIQLASLPAASWKRPAFEELSNPSILSVYRYNGLLGEDTPDMCAHFFINLAGCLLDDNYHIQCPCKVPGCVIVKDYGIKTMSLGNAGGGSYHGDYRWIGVRDRSNNMHNIYLAVFATGKTINDPVFGTRKGHTYLICGIEEGGKPVSRLQINLDACSQEDGDGYRITHTGARSRGKIQPLVDYISQVAPELLGDNSRFDFGHLKADENLYLSEPAVAEVIGKISSYILLRGELRQLEKDRSLYST